MRTHEPFARIICAFVFLFLSSSSFCWEEIADADPQYRYFLTLNAGMNTLQKGFPGYANSYFLGADFYFTNNYSVRRRWSAWCVSTDDFPMTVPDGVYGTSEDLFDVSLSKVYFFPYKDDETSLPFLGIGFGVYGDWIRVNTPATGSLSNINYYAGASLSAGWRFEVADSLDLVPEIRTHFTYVTGGYCTMNSTFGLGLLWRFNQE